ncbi:RNA polymerase sigma factor [Hymenobacter setariae]|uniref:RNA polymerase sigma factor n=1 Tax=Hymenobacter setariae TaxID=2594794 RepID=A0A558BSZ9_9BACT|nr:RNA polymerase sigma factor [Hymenobacter setariae]TVT39615.1 RNA polymerase sigma factor [Hymenobacter setariae]
MTARQQQDARHREAVRAYYETGNEALLGPMLTELRPRLVDFLRDKDVRQPQRIEDAVQEALLAALTDLRAHKYVTSGTVASWAMTICWHRFVDAHRYKKAHITQPGPDEDPFLLLSTTLATPAESLPINQEEEAQAGTVVAAVTHAVLGLDPNARACVLMHYYQGLPEATAAAHLGIAPSQFKARLQRGLTSLREWGTRNRHLAPATEVYAALLRVDSGDLFREPLRLAC